MLIADAGRENSPLLGLIFMVKGLVQALGGARVPQHRNLLKEIFIFSHFSLLIQTMLPILRLLHDADCELSWVV